MPNDLMSRFGLGRALLDYQPPVPADLMAQPSTGDVRNRLAGTVVRRGTIAPLAEYADGSIKPAWPNALYAPAMAVKSLFDNRQHVRDNPSMIGDAFNAASLAMSGGIGLSAAGVRMAPRGAIGANRFTLDFGKPVTVIENPTAAELSGFIRRTKYKAARILDDPDTGTRYAWDAGDPALHSHVAEQLGVKLSQSERGKIAIIDDAGRLAHE